MKVCSKCFKGKSINDFNNQKLGKNGKRAECKKCQKKYNDNYHKTHVKQEVEYARQWRSLNGDKVNKIARRYRKNHPIKVKRNRNKSAIKTYHENKNKLIAYLKDHPCSDCGNSDIRVLEFHHVKKKYRAVTHLLSSSWNIVLREIKKCIVICANCHKIRHSKR